MHTTTEVPLSAAARQKVKIRGHLLMCLKALPSYYGGTAAPGLRKTDPSDKGRKTGPVHGCNRIRMQQHTSAHHLRGRKVGTMDACLLRLLMTHGCERRHAGEKHAAAYGHSCPLIKRRNAPSWKPFPVMSEATICRILLLKMAVHWIA